MSSPDPRCPGTLERCSVPPAQRALAWRAATGVGARLLVRYLGAVPSPSRPCGPRPAVSTAGGISPLRVLARWLVAWPIRLREGEGGSHDCRPASLFKASPGLPHPARRGHRLPASRRPRPRRTGSRSDALGAAVKHGGHGHQPAMPRRVGLTPSPTFCFHGPALDGGDPLPWTHRFSALNAAFLDEDRGWAKRVAAKMPTFRPTTRRAGPETCKQTMAL